MTNREPDKVRETMLKIILTIAAVVLAAFLQGKIGLSELNMVITVFGAAFYATVGVLYLVLFIVDGHKYLCNLMYSAISFVFCIMTVLWIIFAQYRHVLPEWLDFLYGWVTLWLFVVLAKKPYSLIKKHYEQKERDN